MSGPRGQGRGVKGEEGSESSSLHSDQIDYLLQQSTQGLHFIFDHADVARILRKEESPAKAISLKDMDRVQGLLVRFLEQASLEEKRGFLDQLPKSDYELLVRAYFQLVDKAILANTFLKH